jgi:hypothetical protein
MNIVPTFENRTQIIKALETEFGHNPKGFNNNERTKSNEKFWTYNRLLRFYWDIRQGNKETYRTQLNEETGYYELKQ